MFYVYMCIANVMKKCGINKQRCHCCVSIVMVSLNIFVGNYGNGAWKVGNGKGWKDKMGAVTIKRAKNHVRRPPKFFENCILLNIFSWCHFNPMVIMGSSIKWKIWFLEKFKIKIEKKLFWVLVLLKDLWTWTTIA